jgi:signal transduction histidine kinase
MRLSEFILTHREAILADWVEFARTRLAVTHGMSELALRDDAEDILTEVARDMLSPQGSSRQLAKSQGMNADEVSELDEPARAHALQRARSGFEVNQMVAEYRALRATVLRLWSRSPRQVSVEDIDDVTRFNEAIDEALATSLRHFVTEVDRARNLFLGVLGHDLRTPLSTIVNCAKTLELQHPEGHNGAQAILRSAGKMKSLVDVVLAYTRKSLGVTLPIKPEEMLLEDVVRDAVQELEHAIPGRQIDYTSVGDSTGQWDRLRMGQMVSNVVGNALKYGTAGQAVTVTLDASDRDEIVLQVRNLGSPIPDAMLNDIFEPLVRGTNVVGHQHAGGADMGLGLYIAREVVSAHLGSIRATSSDEAGTVFEIRLPKGTIWTDGGFES